MNSEVQAALEAWVDDARDRVMRQVDEAKEDVKPLLSDAADKFKDLGLQVVRGDVGKEYVERQVETILRTIQTQAITEAMKIERASIQTAIQLLESGLKLLSGLASAV